MIFHENRLLADDSHEISHLIFFFEIGKDVNKFVVCCRVKVTIMTAAADKFCGIFLYSVGKIRRHKSRQQQQ